MRCEMCGERHPQAHPDIPGVDTCEYWWSKREAEEMSKEDGREKLDKLFQYAEEMSGAKMQPIIHQSQLSSVKIDTDGKGNAKPSVHVYDENPGTAKRIAVRIYRELQEDLKPGPPPEPVILDGSAEWYKHRLDELRLRLDDKRQAGVWEVDEYQRGFVNGLINAIAILENMPPMWVDDRQYAEVDEEGGG